MNAAPRRVLFSVPNGGSAGSLLRSGVLSRLLDLEPDVEVVLASALVRDPAFAREFAHPRVRLENLPPHVPSGLEPRLLGLVQAAYLASNPTESVRIRHAEARAKKTVRWTTLKYGFTRVIAPSMARSASRFQLTDRLVSHPDADALFAAHRPVLYVASNPGLIAPEIPLLRTAVRRGVRSMALDPSWDNFTNKLMPVRRVDRLVVWNDLMKRQAIDIHGYDLAQIRVAGSPQWDLYFRGHTCASREAFFRRIGADPARKLVTLTTTPRIIYAHHDHVLRVLIEAMNSKAWPDPVQVLVRLHPRDDVEPYTAFKGIPHLMIEKPFRPAAVPSGDGLTVDFTEDNRRHLADTLRHSDVIINVASTISIEAAIFDTPIVNVAFDGNEPLPFIQSAARYYRFTHYQNITNRQAVRVAETPAQLVEHVRSYLADPSLDRAGRREVVAEQCQFTDGRSAERVAMWVAAELADLSGARDYAHAGEESRASSR